MVGSLFAGIGGIELGLEMTGGFNTAWQVEQNEYCRRVLAKHWPDAMRYGDVREVGAHNLAAVDVICGGFPCQDISSVGKRAGIRGERSGLWFEYARIVRELRPRFVLVENVRSLLFRGIDAVLGSLAALRYNAEWCVFGAADVGAPHQRDRTFIVAWDANQGDEPSKWAICSQIAHTCGVRQWAAEPRMDRVADGVPNRMDRLGALGNAVVPQCAAVAGHRILAIDAEMRLMPARNVA